MDTPTNTPDGRADQQAFLFTALKTWIPAALILLIAVAAFALIRLTEADGQRAELTRSNQALQASLEQAKNQLQAATQEANAANARAQMVAQTAASEPAPAVNAPVERVMDKPIRRVKAPVRNHTAVAEKKVDDPRWGAMDAKLADQQKQLESARTELQKTRQDLEGSLGSTRDELNGSIARTHDEVAALRMRGERNYYEFDLSKSQAYTRTGPVSLALRKANVKRKYYDLALVIDDQRIEKKRVNLYEPLWLSLPDRAEPVQLVVNSISKDNVKGYISEPKYKKSELSASAGSPPPPVGSGEAAEKSLTPR